MNAANKDKSAKADAPNVQGEGDYEAARRHRSKLKNFISHTDVESVARAAAPHSTAEAQALRDAEEQGKARSKAKSKAPPRGSGRAK